MKSAKELIEIISDNHFETALFHFESICCYLNDSNDDEFETNELALTYLEAYGLKNFKELEYVSNTDMMYCIIYFTDDDVYLKLTGEYDSYGQGDHTYDDAIQQVFPKEVMITQYLTK